MIRKTKSLIHLVDQLRNPLYLSDHLLLGHENMSVVLGKGPNPHETVKLS